MYPRNITERILELQAKGFTAEETRLAIKEQNDKEIGLATIYRHRTGTASKEIADETLKQQQRSILKQEQANPQLAMKYRNELLKLLIPQRIEQKIEGSINDRVEIIDNRTVQDASKTT